MSDRPPVNILLVDDQPAKLLAYETILAELGENLVRAGSGTEALRQLLHNSIAVVLVDVCMPEIDGFELATMIRSHPRFRKTAIILVSGIMVEDVDRLKGYHSGAVDYVSVPIVPEILRAKVAVFAELYRKTEELESLNRELEARVAERTAQIEAAMARLQASEEQAQSARRDAEHANRLKDEFLATLSHELRTPLNAISGWAHLLRTERLDDAQQQRALESISRNAELQTNLISEILDVSQIVTGKLRLDRRPLDLRDVVEEAVEMLRLAAEAKRIEVDADLGRDELPVCGDAARLQQVVSNVVSNAIKFTPAGGHVEVRLAAVASSLRITVRDDGPGIAPDFLPYVFDRFRQGDSSSTRPHQGLGLGLAIVRHLVEAHGGTAVAANRTDRPGTELQVVLPRASEAARCEPEPPDEPAGAVSLRGLRVLVVDDEADGREVVATILKGCGAEVCIASSAAEALEAAAFRPDAVLTDVEMPVEDGYGLLRRWRAQEGPQGSTPVAALTAYAGADDQARMLSAGFDLHISKPIRPAELVAAVARMCGRAPGGPA